MRAMTEDAAGDLVFASARAAMPMPHLLDIQTQAFQSLLVPDDVEGDRQDVSLERVFRDLFPIADVNGKYSLEFVGYALGEPKYSVEECIERDMTYAAPLKAPSCASTCSRKSTASAGSRTPSRRKSISASCRS